MNVNTSITVWINRIFMIPFLISLFFGIWDSGYLIYSYLIAVPLGIFQLFSFLLSVIYYYDLEMRLRRYMIIYFTLVVTYFTTIFIVLNYLSSFKLEILENIIRFLPVLLSFFWSYILESIKRKL